MSLAVSAPVARPRTATPAEAERADVLALRRLTAAQLLVTLWLRRWVLLLAFGLPVAGGLALALTRQPVFEAETSMLIQVTRESVGAADLSGLGPTVQTVEQLRVVRSEMEIATSRPVARRAVERLGPATIAPGLANPRPWQRALTPEEQVEAATTLLGRSLRADTEPSTNILRLRYRATDRARATLVLEAVLEAYLRQRSETGQEGGARLLTSDLARQREELRGIEREIQEAQARFGVMELGQDIALANARLNALLERENSLREQRAAAAAQLASAQERLAAEPERVFAGSEATNLAPNDEARNTLARLLQERRHIATHYAPGAPELRELDQRIANVRQTLERNERTAFATRRDIRNPNRDALEARVIASRIELDSLTRQLEEVRVQRGEAEARATTLRGADAVLRDLFRRRDALDGITRTLAAREAGVRLEESARREGAAAVQLVQPPTAPFEGRSGALLFAAAGLVAGFTLAGAGLVLLTLLRRTPATPGEAVANLRLPVLASFARPDEEAPLADLAGLLLDQVGPRPVLHLAGEGDDARGLLARALAEEFARRRGRTVLLLDLQTDGAAHLRALGGTPEAVERVEGHVLAFPTAHERLWVAYESQHSQLTDPRAGEAEAARMLALLKREFDVILVVGADGSGYAARRLAGLMDANLLVVRGEVTTLRAARARRDEILAAGGALPGLAFTGRRQVLPGPLAALAT